MLERRELPFAWSDVRARLQGRIFELLPALGIVERPANGLVTPKNPTRNDRRAGSFVIWTGGEAVGGWCDYATGEKGDVFDLIAYLGRLQAKMDAYWWALDFLGLGRGTVRTAGEAQQERERRAREAKAAEARAAGEADDKAKKARGLWLGCQADLRGTPAWTYLTKARGLPLDTVDWTPGALRFHPALEHIEKATGEVTSWPALVSCMSRWSDGALRAVHRTYLAPDGLAKAPVETPKKMQGVAAGCAIRLWKGGSALTPEKAAKAGERKTLILTEGIEDGLTAAIASPAARVWAAGSLSLMGRLGWPDCAGAVVLVADNDWETPQAVAAFEKVAAHWRDMAKGRPLKVVRAQAGKDLNDWARGGG